MFGHFQQLHWWICTIIIGTLVLILLSSNLLIDTLLILLTLSLMLPWYRGLFIVYTR